MSPRALAYARHDGHSDTGLREKFEALAAENSLELGRVVIDPTSGGLMDKGMKFPAVLVELHAGGATVLILDSLISLSAEKVEQEILLAHLSQSGISVMCTDDRDLSAHDPERKLMRDFTSRTELLKKLQALRLTGTRAAARQRSGAKPGGTKAYGTLAGEDRILERIHILRAAGNGPSAIARALNDNGVPTRYGKKWHPTTVANVLGARRDAAQRKARRGSKS